MVIYVLLQLLRLVRPQKDLTLWVVRHLIVRLHMRDKRGLWAHELGDWLCWATRSCDIQNFLRRDDTLLWVLLRHPKISCLGRPNIIVIAQFLAMRLRHHAWYLRDCRRKLAQLQLQLLLLVWLIRAIFVWIMLKLNARARRSLIWLLIFVAFLSALTEWLAHLLHWR